MNKTKPDQKAPFLRPGMARLEQLIETILWTGWIEKERPVSALLVAPPGAGKSSLLEAFDSDYSPFTSDATSREISRLLRDHRAATHLLIGDFMSVLRHKKGTSDLTINLISQLSGDTLKVDAFTGDQVSRRMGIVSAIPPQDIKEKKIRKIIESGGFASRFMIALYDYTPQTISQIHRYIRDGNYRQESKPILRAGPPVRTVSMSITIAKEIESLALIVKRDPIGARAHHYLRTLAMALAAKEGKTAVEDKHVDALSSMSEFFRVDGVKL